MTAFCQSNFHAACLEHYKNDTIIVLGDSHVNFFSGNEHLTFLPIGNDINTCPMKNAYAFTPLHIGPCLAYHSNHYGTTVQFREKTDYLLQHFIKPHATLLCCLGEIDIRVHVFKQAALLNRPFTEIIDDILNEYRLFLQALVSNGYRVNCWGPIASQSENCPLDEHFPRNGSEQDRNRATAYFNKQLSRLCNDMGIGFLSIFNDMITTDYRTKEEYLSEDRCHLGQAALPLAMKEFPKLDHSLISGM